MSDSIKVAVIGGGAAGFFSALSVKEHQNNVRVTIFEKSSKLLSKVKISGGGRCNVTNAETSIKKLSAAYPRGGKALKKAFTTFNTKHTRNWFESRGIPLVVQEDQCIFPEAQDSQVVIDCFMNETKKMGIEIKTGTGIKSIEKSHDTWILNFIKEEQVSENFDKIIIATGGSPRRSGLQWLEDLGHKIEEPVPSLFTFNMPEEPIKSLMGIVIEETQVSIEGTKLLGDGPLLITHWGMSGPAILKLSAFGARILSDKNYEFVVSVNWVNEKNVELVGEEIYKIMRSYVNKLVVNFRPYGLKERLWLFLVEKANIPGNKKWGELSKKEINRMIEILTHDRYTVSGKTTFKEEFVTCGGVSLESINFKTMESKVCPGIYFAGEVMDVDGITGGYNFQAAWTTAYIAGQLN